MKQASSVRPQLARDIKSDCKGKSAACSQHLDSYDCKLSLYAIQYWTAASGTGVICSESRCLDTGDRALYPLQAINVRSQRAIQDIVVKSSIDH